MFSYKAMWLAQQGKIIGILVHLFMHWQLCVMESMIQRIAWQRNCHGILKKAQIEISIGSTKNPWGLSNDVCWGPCAFSTLPFSYTWFAILLCLVHDHSTLFAVSYCYWFSWFSSCLFLVLPFYVLRVLGIGWERRKLMELWESFVEPNM